MQNLKIHTSPKAIDKFDSYPKEIRIRLDNLRALIIESATESPLVTEIEETLKWGELSYLTKKGSTIRIDWKLKSPHQYAMFFKCTSKLVPTFKEVYGSTFRYEKNRAILFKIEEQVPQDELKECIRLALEYHTLKHLPLLGK